MTHAISVPPRLQKPLHIDTDMTYDLDMSKFPGLDDPKYMYQPALLIAPSQDHANFCKSMEYYGQGRARRVMNSSQCPNSPKLCREPSTRDVMEELLNVIDSCSSELLDRLVDTGSQTPVAVSGQIRYKALVDSCGHPETYTFPGNPHTVCSRTTHYMNTNTSDYQPTRGTHTGINLYTGSHYSNQSYDANMFVSKYSSNQTSSLVGLLPRQVSDNASCKRKRSTDWCDMPMLKRQCNRPNTINYYGHGNISHYPTFQEIVHSRGVVV